MTLEEVWVVRGSRNDEEGWIECVFTTEADAEACAAWMKANPPADGRFDSVHAPRYSYEAEMHSLCTSFSPERPYG